MLSKAQTQAHFMYFFLFFALYMLFGLEWPIIQFSTLKKGPWTRPPSYSGNFAWINNRSTVKNVSWGDFTSFLTFCLFTCSTFHLKCCTLIFVVRNSNQHWKITWKILWNNSCKNRVWGLSQLFGASRWTKFRNSQFCYYYCILSTE